MEAESTHSRARNKNIILQRVVFSDRFGGNDFVKNV